MTLHASLGRAAVCALLLFSTSPCGAPFAYVVRSGGGTAALVAIDLSTNAIAATIPIDSEAIGVAISPSGRFAYLPHWMNDRVSVVDLTVNRVVARIAISAPMGIAFDPSEKHAYVTSMGTDVPGSTVTVVDVATHTVSLVSGGFFGPTGIVVNPAGTRVYVGSASGVIAVRDASSMAPAGAITLPMGTFGLAINAAGTRLYATHLGDDGNPKRFVSVADLTTHSPMATIPVDVNPFGLALSPSGARLYVANSGSGTVSVIDTATNRVVNTIYAGYTPMAVALHPSGGSLYVIDDLGGSMHVFDTATFTRGPDIAIGAPGNEALGFVPFVGPHTTMASTTPGILSGIWYNPTESGWGVQLTQRRNSVFATWYTYDANGSAKWYAMDSCTIPNMACPTCVTNANCIGDVYETAGPRFFGVPFDSPSVCRYDCGNLRIAFRDSDRATLTYTVSGQSRSIPIQRYVFRAPATMPVTDYTDMWWNPNESGWGLSVTHQDNVMFLAWYVYGDSGKPTWYAVSNCAVSGNTCTGDLHRYSGPPWGPTFNSAMVEPRYVGTATATFTDRDAGVLTYSVEGIGGSKPIRRFLF